MSLKKPAKDQPENFTFSSSSLKEAKDELESPCMDVVTVIQSRNTKGVAMEAVPLPTSTMSIMATAE